MMESCLRHIPIAALLVAALPHLATAESPPDVTVAGKVAASGGAERRDSDTRLSRALRATNYVVGGEVAKEGDWPFVVALAYKNQEGKYTQYCGGTLLSPRSVLTAAHCPVEIGDYVIVGRLDLTSSGGQAIPVIGVAAHEGYNPTTHENDISVLTLGRSAASATFPELRDASVELPAGQPVTALGWGRTTEKGTSSLRLRQVDVPSVSNTKCHDAYKAEGYAIVSTMMCAGREGKDSCQGDSGGPLFLKDNNKRYLVGVTSFGIGCARQKYPGVYTRVGAYLEWIKSHVRS